MTCPTCRGTGECQACDGWSVDERGMDECPECDGTTACPRCQGDGELPE